MSKPFIDDDEFISMFQRLGGSGLSRELQMDLRAIMHRRRKIERDLGVIINPPGKFQGTSFAFRRNIEIENGVVIVGSDAHYWPNDISGAHKAAVLLCKELSPVAFIMNGDAFDGASISRHPPIGWENKPSVRQELEECNERLSEIKCEQRYWNIGNHDGRFEHKLAKDCPEFAGTKGFSLVDHFPEWTMQMSLWINQDVVIKHRWKGGIHATHNNTLWSGKTMVTGHLHSLKVTPFDDYNGTRWGVDTGTMSHPYSDKFNYGEDNPVNHRQGLIVLTFKDGVLLWPEVVHIIDNDKMVFRGVVRTV